MALSQLATTVSVAVLLYLTSVGFGRHVVVLILEHSDSIRTFLGMVVAGNALYFPSICFSKLSILFQYRRLFPSRRFRSVLIAVGAASIAYCIIALSLFTALCVPIQVPTLENPLVPPLACTNIVEMVLWLCSLNSVLDLIILVLPMHYVWRLNVTLRRKLQLTFVFLFGSFVVAISIIRTWYFTKLDFHDYTWSGSMGNMWTEVGGCMAIVVGCLPAMVPIFRQGCFGRREPAHRPARNINLVTFGSSGKRNKLRDVSDDMTTTIDDTTHGVRYTALNNRASHENQTA